MGATCAWLVSYSLSLISATARSSAICIAARRSTDHARLHGCPDKQARFVWCTHSAKACEFPDAMSASDCRHSCIDGIDVAKPSMHAGMTALHSHSNFVTSRCGFHPAFHSAFHFVFPSCHCRYSAFALAMILSFASVIPIVSICRLAQCAKPSGPAMRL